MKSAYIVSGLRTAVGKAKKGGFRFVRPDDLAANVIKSLVKTTKGLEGKMVDDLIVGMLFQKLNKVCKWLGTYPYFLFLKKFLGL